MPDRLMTQLGLPETRGLQVHSATAKPETRLPSRLKPLQSDDDDDAIEIANLLFQSPKKWQNFCANKY